MSPRPGLLGSDAETWGGAGSAPGLGEVTGDGRLPTQTQQDPGQEQSISCGSTYRNAELAPESWSAWPTPPGPGSSGTWAGALPGTGGSVDPFSE